MNEKEAEKILKCKALTVEIQACGLLNIKMIPLIIGATDAISKSYRQYLSNRPGKQKINELQEKALLCASRIFRMVLM